MKAMLRPVELLSTSVSSVLLLLATSCTSPQPAAIPSNNSTSSGAGTAATYNTITSTSGKSAPQNASDASSLRRQFGESPVVPDPKMTPGDALDVTKEDICTPGYSKKVRNVSQAIKEQAYREYGITSREPGEYEVDHLISLELGGSNSVKNLWPESFRTEPWNAHVKDRLENKLHEMICSGEIDIKVAQREIATDWIGAYKKYVESEPSRSNNNAGRESRSSVRGKTNASPAPTAVSSSGEIVGNKRSHIYHKPGCPGYDKVSEANRVMFGSAAEAEKAGYRAAKNCP